MSAHSSVPNKEIFALISKLSHYVAEAEGDHDKINEFIKSYHDEVAKLENLHKRDSTIVDKPATECI